MVRIWFRANCSECDKKLGFFEGYIHPIEGEKKCVCKKCWDELETSQRKYSKFISNAFNRKSSGAICFILIRTVPTYEQKIHNKLSKISQIIELNHLLGKYDIIAKIRVEDFEKLGNIVLKEIRTIEGIKSTKTLTGTFSLIGS
jgi:DNA-binding Lrp family transcriptional regulator